MRNPDEWLNHPEIWHEQQEDWLKKARDRILNMPQAALDIRERARADLYYCAKLVNPGYIYGSVHKEIYSWLQEYTLYKDEEGEGITSNKLILLPRGHLKSHMVATWCVWVTLRHPEVSILYVSATSDLASKQIYAIENMFDSPSFQRYFPEYVSPNKGERESWSTKRLNVDHPHRKEEGVRDPTVAIAGLTTNTTGWHADVVIADDLVVPENAYTEEGRESVQKKASQFTSVRNAGGFTLACGTTYHPKDIYSVWTEQTYEIYNDLGEIVDVKPVWEIKKYIVETDGLFIWPRSIRDDGKAFGFSHQVLSRIKSEYSDTVQFFAQYYLDPNDPFSERISRDKFQYYSPRLLTKQGGRWYYKERRLNVYAAVDFAFSLSTKADFTAIIVIGVDSDWNIYVLDIDRFKSDKTIEYFQHIKHLHGKWKFNKLQAEVTVAQKVIVESLKDYIKADGMRLSVVEYRPSKYEGSKEERIAATLEPKYDDYKVWHLEGGWTNVLEDEIVQARPAHDDLKDALSSAIMVASPPTRGMGSAVNEYMNRPKSKFNSRFGGVNFRG